MVGGSVLGQEGDTSTPFYAWGHDGPMTLLDLGAANRMNKHGLPPSPLHQGGGSVSHPFTSFCLC